MLLVSFNSHTCVCDQECFIPSATMASAPGEKAADKRLNPTAANVPRLSLVSAVTAAAAAVSRTSFLFWLRATTWILVKDGGEGAFRAGDQCVKQLRWLPVLKIEKKINFYLQGGGSCSCDEPERFDWVFVAIKLNSELPLSSDQKTANTSQYKVTIRTVSYWYLVETHSIPDQNEVENLTDLNVDATQ